MLTRKKCTKLSPLTGILKIREFFAEERLANRDASNKVETFGLGQLWIVERMKTRSLFEGINKHSSIKAFKKNELENTFENSVP